MTSIKNNFYLPGKEIHVWVIDMKHYLASDCMNYPVLPSSNLDFSSLRTSVKHSEKLLRYLLSHYLEISPEFLVIENTERGKPILPSYPEISFSLAHSGDLLVLAFARDLVGIDLEKKRSVKAMAIAQKFFFPHEIKFLQSSPEKHFFYLWTAKEASLKADGCGITEGLRQAITVIEENIVTGVYLQKRLITITPWSLDAPLEDHFIGSIASFFPPSLIRWYDLRSACTLSH